MNELLKYLMASSASKVSLKPTNANFLKTPSDVYRSEHSVNVPFSENLFLSSCSVI